MTRPERLVLCRCVPTWSSSRCRQSRHFERRYTGTRRTLLTQATAYCLVMQKEEQEELSYRMTDSPHPGHMHIETRSTVTTLKTPDNQAKSLLELSNIRRSTTKVQILLSNSDFHNSWNPATPDYFELYTWVWSVRDGFACRSFACKKQSEQIHTERNACSRYTMVSVLWPASSTPAAYLVASKT